MSQKLEYSIKAEDYDYSWYNKKEPRLKKKQIVHNDYCKSDGKRKVRTCRNCNRKHVIDYDINVEHCISCQWFISTRREQNEDLSDKLEQLAEKFPNKYQVTKIWLQQWKYDYYDSHEHFEAFELHYKTVCGDVYEQEHNTLQNVANIHKSCAVCNILKGKSKANVLKQDDVAKLFSVGIDGKRSPSDNLSSSNGILTHYRTIEALRLTDGTVVANSQCWSSGFARCPSHHTDVSLPLTTIQDIGRVNSDSIKILDNKDRDEALFTLKDGDLTKTLLYGHDEREPFVVEIAGNPKTLAEAYANLKPQIVKEFENTRDIKRQGDIYFVPVPKSEVDNANIIQIDTFYNKFSRVPYKTPSGGIANPWEFDRDSPEYERCEKLHSNLRALNNIHEGLFHVGDDTIDDNEINRIFEDDLMNERKRLVVEFYKTLPVVKELVRPTILNTNHKSQSIAQFGEFEIVKGKVRHERRQHQILVLEDWHIALKNLAVQSWQVQARGFGGGGD